MTLMDFPPLDRQVVEWQDDILVKVAPKPSTSQSHIMIPVEQWTWRECRDYVVGQIEIRRGPWDRFLAKEVAI